MAFDGCRLVRRAVLGGTGAAAAVALLRLDSVAAADSPALAATALVAAPGRLALLPGPETAVLSFNGQVPGPLIRLKRGGLVDVRFDNRLDKPATITWQGVRLAEAAGCGTTPGRAPVQPGQSCRYRFAPPDSGLFWYHPATWPDGAALTARGLYGVLLVDETSPPAVDADVLVVIDDWMLGADRQIIAPPIAGVGAAGPGPAGAAPLFTANSKPLPMAVEAHPGARVRLRLLNVCRARLALVGCSGMAATVIGVDGQPSSLFEPARGTVPIGPGSRFELIVDLPRELPRDPSRNAGAPPTTPQVTLQVEGLAEQPLLRFVLKGEALPSRGAVPKLADNPLLPTRIHLENSLKRELVIEGKAGNVGSPPAAPPPAGKRPTGTAPTGTSSIATALTWTMAGKPVAEPGGRPLFTVKAGTPVTLAFVNRTGFAQQARLQGHCVRVLHDLDDGWDPYWRDSVLVGPGRTKHVAFVADQPGCWMIDAVALDGGGSELATSFRVDPR